MVKNFGGEICSVVKIFGGEISSVVKDSVVKCATPIEYNQPCYHLEGGRVSKEKSCSKVANQKSGHRVVNQKSKQNLGGKVRP